MPERIALVDCEDRRLYKIHSRNLTVGVFRAEAQGFIGIREKFRETYLFEEYHYDTGAPHGTVHPLEALDEVLPPEILLAEYLPSKVDPSKHHGSFCTEHDREVEFRPDDGVRPPGKWFHLDDDTELVEGDNPSAKGNQALYDWLVPHTDWLSTYEADVAEKRAGLKAH